MGKFRSDESYGNNGLFVIDGLRIIASDEDGWEHISVSKVDSVPTWDEMCFVKEVFWDDDDVVMQLHPKKSEYVNCCNNCLHLWRPIGKVIPTPPRWMLAPDGVG